MPSLTEMPRRYLPETAVALAIILLVALWPRPPKQPAMLPDVVHVAAIDSTPPETAESLPVADSIQVRSALSAALEDGDRLDPEASFAGELPEIERVVLVLLRQGRDTDAINRWLASLPGYQGPQAGEATTIGGVQFFTALAREHASYVLMPLTPTRPEAFALLLSFPSVNGPSRMAIVNRDAGHWHAAFEYQSERQIEGYTLGLDSGSPLVVVFERFWRGDGSEGTLHAWRLSEPMEAEIPLGLPELQDAEIATTDSSLTVSAAQFLAHTQDCILCSRRGIEATVQAGSVPTVTTRELTPWVAVVDSLYGVLGDRRVVQAKGLLADSTLVSSLTARRAAIAEDAGSLERGIGEVTLRLEEGRKSRTVRVTSVRQVDGEWRIVRVVTGGR